MLGLTLLVLLRLLLNLLQSGCHDSTAVNKSHCHLGVCDSLDHVLLLQRSLVRLGQEQLPDRLLGGAPLLSAGQYLHFEFERVNRRVGCQHWHGKEQLISRLWVAGKLVNLGHVHVLRDNVDVLFFDELRNFSLFVHIGILLGFFKVLINWFALSIDLFRHFLLLLLGWLLGIHLLSLFLVIFSFREATD